ncbi:MAG: hypothetical protein CHACPFDD_03279 [Phycisphaerae bacterium]|nr:hypothetical protein [Phycisphaerae bacterium]
MLSVLGVISAVTWLTVLTSQAQDQPAGGAGFKPAAPREALMEWHEKAFNNARKAVSGKKAKDLAENAWLLSELANVNGFHGENDDYRNWAREVSTKAAELAAAGKEKQFDKAAEIVKGLNATCKSCHDVYKKRD